MAAPAPEATAPGLCKSAASAAVSEEFADALLELSPRSRARVGGTRQWDAAACDSDSLPCERGRPREELLLPAVAANVSEPVRVTSMCGTDVDGTSLRPPNCPAVFMVQCVIRLRYVPLKTKNKTISRPRETKDNDE